jgi:hypothetical protein
MVLNTGDEVGIQVFLYLCGFRRLCIWAGSRLQGFCGHLVATADLLFRGAAGGVGECRGDQFAQCGLNVAAGEPALHRAEDVPAVTDEWQPGGMLVVLGVDTGRQVIDPDGDHVRDLEPAESNKMKMVLLTAIVADMHLDDAGLDEFMAKARAFADQLLS